VDLDLNQKPKPTTEVHDGEENGYEFENYAESSRKRRKTGREKKTVKHGGLSWEENLVEYGEQVQEDNAVHCGGVEIDFLGLSKKRPYRRRTKNGSKPILMWNQWEEEHERWIDGNLTKDFDLGLQNEVIIETAEAPTELIMPLLRYQKEWLAWALKQENSTTGGGILADEMGMGKTIQAIALVLARREIHRMCESNKPSVLPGPSEGVPGIKATLVICPVVAVSQWVSEIDRFTSEGSTKVLVYHGAKRGKNSKQFRDYDFVITTYSIVEAEYRKHMMPPKTECPYCGRSFYDRKLSVHLKYFCGPDAVRTEKQSKQARKKGKTVPSNQKMESAEDKINECDGKKRKGAFKKTSYLQSKEKDMGIRFRNENSDGVEGSSRGKSFLHDVKWERVILDEVSRHKLFAIRELSFFLLVFEFSILWSLALFLSPCEQASAHALTISVVQHGSGFFSSLCSSDEENIYRVRLPRN
jgi:DNA repair protein RAD16